VGILGAMKDAALHHDGRGASTITQQLAKNMFRVRSQYSTGLLGKIPGLKILIGKSKEWIIATKLETVFNKQEILTMYANTVDFGSNAYGIKTAAKTYFDTTPKDLTTQEAAVLVGMLKATTLYNPKSNPENSMRRRNTVLENIGHPWRPLATGVRLAQAAAHRTALQGRGKLRRSGHVFP
jgi:penicillin-binding protein 1A